MMLLCVYPLLHSYLSHLSATGFRHVVMVCDACNVVHTPSSLIVFMKASQVTYY